MLKVLKKKTKKEAKKETLIRHRIGNYELRISEVKCEIEDVVNKLTKHVYNIGGYEYGLIAFHLGGIKKEGEATVPKTSLEVADGIKNVEFLIYMMAYTNLLFSNVEFREKYYALVQEFVAKATPTEISKEEDDAILDEMRVAEEMKEAIKE